MYSLSLGYIYIYVVERELIEKRILQIWLSGVKIMERENLVVHVKYRVYRFLFDYKGKKIKLIGDIPNEFFLFIGE